MQFSPSKFIANERVSVSKYDMLINIHCGKSKLFILIYQIARNFPISYAYATIENEIVRNNKIFFPIYAVLPLSQLSNYTKI